MAKIAGRKKRIIVTTAVLAAISGGAAFAYWSATGTGVGEAKTAADSVPFTFVSQAATGGPLSPGGTQQTVAFAVTNPGTGVQYLADVEVTVDEDWSVGTTLPCTAADFTVGPVVVTKGSINAGASVNGTVKVTMNNSATNQDNCKGVTVPLVFSAS
ncbi:hypothetical protein [Arthrobacter sp. ISL-65]|uniref:hypothetical protein n=1 Tax=Arthrobacter sp. ISL-65 TaxID=2819112 RepID=UPI001BE50BF2|nr:hypothetical protein [Arthrobacter sp. ISL-65]MBT2549594.1 hypothetical protein [Arthrobacter sp. ISL-65]